MRIASGPLLGPSVGRGGPRDGRKTSVRKLSPPGSLCPPSTLESTFLGRWPQGHFGQSLASSRTPTATLYPPGASTTLLADASLPPRRSGKVARYRFGPTGTHGIDKLPPPRRIRNKTRLLEPRNQPSRASHRYPGSVSMPLFGVWICAGHRHVFTCSPLYLMASQNGKDNKPPVDKVRFGGVTANIYANKVENSDVPLHKVTVSRTYVDKKNEFRTVTSFRMEDLPFLVHVLQEAWKRIGDMKQQAWEESRKDAPELA